MTLELRAPPQPATAPAPKALLGVLVGLQVFTVAAVVWSLVRPPPVDTAERRLRTVASKLKAAGAEDAAAELYGDYLAASDGEPQSRANIAFSLGELHFDAGRYPAALRWYYEAEALGVGVDGDLKGRIVATLERLGRVHAARAALRGGTALEQPADEANADDPVVATVGDRKIRRGEVERMLDELPPELAKAYGDKKEELLARYVADELIYRKAENAGFSKDPKVERAQAQVLKQLTVNAFIEREVLGKLDVNPVDLESFFTANKERYRDAADGKGGKGPGKEPEFAAVRERVLRDYRGQKLQAAYQELIQKELQAEDVHLFPEAMRQ